jgi:hypothetical protein
MGRRLTSFEKVLNPADPSCRRGGNRGGRGPEVYPREYRETGFFPFPWVPLEINQFKAPISGLNLVRGLGMAPIRPMMIGIDRIYVLLLVAFFHGPCDSQSQQGEPTWNTTLPSKNSVNGTGNCGSTVKWSRKMSWSLIFQSGITSSWRREDPIPSIPFSGFARCLR